MAVHSLSRRSLFAAVPALATVAALPALHTPIPNTNSLEGIRGFLIKYGGRHAEAALDHAIAADLDFADLRLVMFPTLPDDELFLMFRKPNSSGPAKVTSAGVVGFSDYVRVV